MKYNDVIVTFLKFAYNIQLLCTIYLLLKNVHTHRKLDTKIFLHIFVNAANDFQTVFKMNLYKS